MQLDTKRIAEAMERCGINSFRLSIEAEVPQPTIYRMLTRRNLPQVDTLYRICEALGLTIDDVISADVAKKGHERHRKTTAKPQPRQRGTTAK